MLSPSDRAELLALGQQFITSGDDVTLAHLLDAVATKISDRSSPEWQAWSQYTEGLNETWVRIFKENKDIPWPTPPPEPEAVGLDASHTCSSTAVTPASQAPVTLNEKEIRDKMHAERKSSYDGAKGVGPARTSKSTRAERDRTKGGRMRDMLVDELVLEFDERKPEEPLKPRAVVYCIGCDNRTVGRDTARIRGHANHCNELAKSFPTLYRRLKHELAGRSLSQKVDKVSNDEEVEASESRLGANVVNTLHSYMNPAKLNEKQKMKIEWSMLRMFICCAIPWNVMDNLFFEEFISTLSPNFTVPDHSAFFAKHIPQEVAAWDAMFKDFLKGQDHLTFSLDGWSSRANDEIYTFHMTTPTRRSFFTDGHIFRGESVTGDVLKDVIIRLLTTYDLTRYSAIVGDGGPNVRSAKKKLAALYCWIVNIYDPYHNLSLYMKDIGKLFKDMLVTVSGIANYFGKSNYGTYHLMALAVQDELTLWPVLPSLTTIVEGSAPLRTLVFYSSFITDHPSGDPLPPHGMINIREGWQMYPFMDLGVRISEDIHRGTDHLGGVDWPKEPYLRVLRTAAKGVFAVLGNMWDPPLDII
ncbi:hypothetical protein CPB84DRAFT_1751763 [Gymnopilus junonius]|uniref:Uncharacterized protein n=1 Tax=Gymnopilus junonius TaxID=109634 RepID=A0A9P5THP5_GYMJU|nr:hypothetical protein CPB84DRAFT_1751763 [Gymnopilus junonius]